MSLARTVAPSLAPLALLALGALLTVASAGCSPEKPKTKEATDEELQYVETDVHGNPIARRPAPAAPSPPPEQHAGVDTRPSAASRKSSALQADPGEPKPSQDVSTDGPIITIVYVCEIATDEGRRRPGAVIFSSDPDSPYISNERPRPSRILKPSTGEGMLAIIADLQKAGLDSLPREEQKLDEAISGDRQFFILRDGKRVNYRKLATKQDAKLYEAFNRCERVLVRYSAAKADIVETEGLHPAPSPAPGR